MNDRDPDLAADVRRRQLIELFLQRTLSDVEQMRRIVPQLIAGDLAAWQDVRVSSQRIAGTAKSLQLGVLGACAQELAALAEEKFTRANVDAHFLMSVTTGIEVIALELNKLQRELT
jgi:hypothetical protein